MRKLAAVLAITALMAAPAARAQSFESAKYDTTCRDDIVTGNAGSFGPTARCTTSGSASNDGGFRSVGSLTTPANGYAPGSGSVSSTASLGTQLAAAAPSHGVEIVATIHIERAVSNTVRRLGGLAPAVDSTTAIVLGVSNQACGCGDWTSRVVTSTFDWADSEINDQTIVIRTVLRSWSADNPVSGLIDAVVTLDGYASTSLAAVGSASWEIRGRVLSIALA